MKQNRLASLVPTPPVIPLICNFAAIALKGGAVGRGFGVRVGEAGGVGLGGLDVATKLGMIEAVVDASSLPPPQATAKVRPISETASTPIFNLPALPILTLTAEPLD